MSRYHVTMVTTASTHAEVEADTIEDAMDAALQEHAPRPCAACSSGEGNYGGIEVADWEASYVRQLPDAE